MTLKTDKERSGSHTALRTRTRC
jgi:hypothetical protein